MQENILTGLQQQAEALQQLGSLYQEEGEEKEALQYYEQSLSILKALPAAESAPLILLAMKQIGSIHYEMEHFAPALQSFEKALELIGKYTPGPPAPVKLEAAAMATLSAAIQMEQTAGGRKAGGSRDAAQFISLAEQYLDDLEEEDALVEQRQEELNALKGILKGML